MSGQKIMAIDDDMEMLKQLAILLKNQYTVSVMTSAAQALEALNSGECPDLILLDIMMPETNGFSMIEHLKSDPNLRDIPVIFLTGMTDTDDEIKGFDLGGSDYIRKPFNRDVLLSRIAVQLNRNQRHKDKLPDDIVEKLTENETEVAELLYNGYSGKEICEKLFFSYSYIKKLTASLKVKFGAKSTAELIRILRKN